MKIAPIPDTNIRVSDNRILGETIFLTLGTLIEVIVAKTFFAAKTGQKVKNMMGISHNQDPTLNTIIQSGIFTIVICNIAYYLFTRPVSINNYVRGLHHADSVEITEKLLELNRLLTKKQNTGTTDYDLEATEQVTTQPEISLTSGQHREIKKMLGNNKKYLNNITVNIAEGIKQERSYFGQCVFIQGFIDTCLPFITIPQHTQTFINTFVTPPGHTGAPLSDNQVWSLRVAFSFARLCANVAYFSFRIPKNTIYYTQLWAYCSQGYPSQDIFDRTLFKKNMGLAFLSALLDFTFVFFSMYISLQSYAWSPLTVNTGAVFAGIFYMMTSFGNTFGPKIQDCYINNTASSEPDQEQRNTVTTNTSQYKLIYIPRDLASLCLLTGVGLTSTMTIYFSLSKALKSTGWFPEDESKWNVGKGGTIMLAFVCSLIVVRKVNSFGVTSFKENYKNFVTSIEEKFTTCCRRKCNFLLPSESRALLSDENQTALLPDENHTKNNTYGSMKNT